MTDPLLSAVQVARDWGSSVETAIEAMMSGGLATLDGGECARRRITDVACCRLSWVRAMQVDSPGSSRRIDVGFVGIHPAAQAGLDLQIAVQDLDVDRVVELSTEESLTAAGDPDTLLGRWITALGSGARDDISITSGVYLLDPYPGVGIRLVRELPSVPIIVNRPTPMRMAGLIPLAETQDGWRGALLVAELQVAWSELLSSPLPSAGSSASEDSGSSMSSGSSGSAGLSESSGSSGLPGSH